MADNIPVGPQAAAVQNVSGTITATSRARITLPVHNLSGRIGSVSRITLSSPVSLSGRISSAAQARAPLPIHPISGRAGSRSSARLQTFLPVQAIFGRIGGQTRLAFRNFVPDRVTLSGQIASTSQARLRAAQAFLSGRITSAAKGLAKVSWFTGRIKASSTIQLGGLRLNLFVRTSARSQIQLRIANLYTPGQLSVRITSRSSARVAPPLLWQNPGQLTLRITGSSRVSLRTANLYTPGQLSVRITARSQIRLPVATLVPVTQVALTASRITATSTARLRYPDLNQVALFGSITARTQVQSSQTFSSPFSGRVTSRTSVIGSAQNRQNILFGTITAAAVASLIIAEIVPPLPIYPPPFLTHELGDYLDKITSEHNQKPKYLSTVGISVNPLVEDAQLVAGIIGLFDLDYSVGQQEDFTGQWIGKSRWIEIPGVFFAWDQEGNGWNQANWKGPLDATNNLERLDDYHYRLLLYATIIANHWDGSIPKAYEAWDTLFAYAGIKVVIQDYGNMTMLYGILSDQILDSVLLSLFLTGEMDLRPEGVQLRAYALQAEPGVPFFAWDSSSDSVLGWDSGQWGKMVPPGQASLARDNGE